MERRVRAPHPCYCAGKPLLAIWVWRCANHPKKLVLTLSEGTVDKPGPTVYFQGPDDQGTHLEVNRTLADALARLWDRPQIGPVDHPKLKTTQLELPQTKQPRR